MPIVWSAQDTESKNSCVLYEVVLLRVHTEEGETHFERAVVSPRFPFPCSSSPAAALHAASASLPRVVCSRIPELFVEDSGGSELVQSLIISLPLNNLPQAHFCGVSSWLNQNVAQSRQYM